MIKNDDDNIWNIDKIGMSLFAHALPCFWVVAVFVLSGCAQGLVPQTRNVNIPAPQQADERPSAINEQPDSVMYLPLGRDVLVPEMRDTDDLPDKIVGPFELRGETLGGALQLILADVDLPIAFQTDLGLTRTVTVTNLKGDLADVVDQVCSLADLYCAFEKGALVVKETQTFTVVLPPIGETAAWATMLTSVAGAIQAMTGSTPVIDNGNRTIIYQATNRSSDQVDRYFQRMRASTSMVVFETYIWEVSLDSDNAAGIQWSNLGAASKFNFGVSINGTIDPDAGAPISIGLPTTGPVNFNAGDVLKFISSYGAVKTISQPQLTVLSGSTARLRVADTQNYVSEITRTVVDNQTTVSNQTDSVESGFTLEIGSSWDNSTVYGNINIALNELRDLETFDDNPDAIVQLPQTTTREVQTQVRVRPGDSLLIAGLVREIDSMRKSGLGIDKPIIPTNRSTAAGNIELVFLLKPRVIAFVEHPEKYNRVPVRADHPAQPVSLPRGADQAQAPAPAVDVVSASEGSVAEASVAPLPILPGGGADDSVIGRLFETSPMVSVTAPAPEKVVAAPLESPPPKAPRSKKKTQVSKKKSTASEVSSVPRDSESKTVTDIAEAILNTPASSDGPIANDLPALTDGTVLPSVSSPAPTEVTP